MPQSIQDECNPMSSVAHSPDFGGKRQILDMPEDEVSSLVDDEEDVGLIDTTNIDEMEAFVQVINVK
jgi:hypothetical protein